MIRRKGVRVRELNGTTIKTRVSAELSPADLSEVDLVIFTVKSYDTEEAARLHKSNIDAGSVILTVQNGLSNAEILSKVFGREDVLAGTTTEASFLVGPGDVVHTGKGKTWVGEPNAMLSTRCAGIAKVFGRAGIKTVASRNIQGVIWSKTIVNSAVNPVSALTHLPNGALVDVSGLKEVMLGVIREGVAVSKSTNIRLEPDDPSKLLSRVLKATASNRSSMLQDVEKGKPTEILQLNGAIAELGKWHKIPTPLNQLLTSLVLGMELARR
jgi:2-dehydropantoate 2-reductase